MRHKRGSKAIYPMLAAALRCAQGARDLRAPPRHFLGQVHMKVIPGWSRE
jgi:hypothetical protein